MKTRGRKSAASQNIVNLVDVRQEKPAPPSHLSKEQQAVWRDVVESMKVDTFPQSVHVLLELYAVHVSRARFIEQLLSEIDIREEPKKFKMWASMQCAQTAMLMQLSTKLRLVVRTNTRLTRQETGVSGAPWNIRKPRPWEDSDGTPAA